MPERENLITTSGVPIDRVYTPQDNENLDYTRDLALPGEFPFTRGVQPTMYRAKAPDDAHVCRLRYSRRY